MIDQNKVISALLNCINQPKCRDCDWEECDTEHYTVELPKGLVMNVIDLLREKKEAKRDIEGGGSSWWYVCEECRRAVDSQDKYCRECGSKLI